MPIPSAALDDLLAELPEALAEQVRVALGIETAETAGLTASFSADATMAFDLDPTEEVPAAFSSYGPYEDLGMIGMGSMGEVRRVRQASLNRTLAMKIAHRALGRSPAALARFVEEAQATAQLQHPGIVPVHDIGRLPDGRLYFTMLEITGRTLGSVIEEVHEARDHGRWEPAVSGWTFRRVMVAFGQICRAVGYAHSRGVVHRDLKPANVMVGVHGEAYVVDWGIAKVVGRPDWVLAAIPAELGGTGSVETVVTHRSRSGSFETQVGRVAGTPAYMAPEQARGENDLVDARSDVFALGAILHEVLSGVPPFAGRSSREILEKVREGIVAPLTEVDSLPSELVAASTRAMSPEPAGRYRTAEQLAEVVEAWLDGTRKRAQALELVDRAAELAPKSEAMRAEARALRATAKNALAEIASWRPESDKAPFWALADRADALERTARLSQLEVDQVLLAALEVVPDLAEAHAALAERYLARHTLAEGERRGEATARAEAKLRHHMARLPEDHPTRVESEVYLAGDGLFTLVTDPPNAEVTLFRFVSHNRRLVPQRERALGKTPLVEVPIAMGSYVCVIDCPGRVQVRYPVEIGRHEHWHGIAPGDSAPTPVHLPAEGSLEPDEVYVPAGWFTYGDGPARRAWSDAFMVDRFSVTNRDYIRFLDDLVAQGREEEALIHVPRERAATETEQGVMVYSRDAAGRFVLVPDADGDLWDMDWPVFMVDWMGARAFLDWRGAKTGRGCRLPGELEWEKAARGVDGRSYPWGDAVDGAWAHFIDSTQGAPLPSVVDSFPVDESVYGVRGLGGNMQDWCLQTHAEGATVVDQRVLPPSVDPESRRARVLRGGGWSLSWRSGLCAVRFQTNPVHRDSVIGFRGARRP